MLRTAPTAGPLSAAILRLALALPLSAPVPA